MTFIPSYTICLWRRERCQSVLSGNRGHREMYIKFWSKPGKSEDLATLAQTIPSIFFSTDKVRYLAVCFFCFVLAKKNYWIYGVATSKNLTTLDCHTTKGSCDVSSFLWVSQTMSYYIICGDHPSICQIRKALQISCWLLFYHI